MTSFISAYIDAIYKHFDLKPKPATSDDDQNRRRQFHGDRSSVEIDAEYTYSWIPIFIKQVMSKSLDGCKEVFERYESRVRRFGYSLQYMGAIFTSELEPFLIDPDVPKKR